MLKETLRAVADKCTKFAQGELIEEGSVGQTIVSIDANGKTDAHLVGPDEDVVELLKQAAKTSIGIIMIFDAYFATVPKDQAGNLPENFKDLPGANSALMCVAYSKGVADVRRLAYSRNTTGGYTFIDLGWDDKEISTDCRFANPFNGGN